MRVYLTIQYLFIHILDLSCIKVVFDRETKLDMTLLTVMDEHVYFLLFVVKSCPSSFIIYYRI